jgi:phospholipase C
LERVPASLPDAGSAVGPAFRVPMIVVSPWTPPGTVFKPVIDHTSILQFVESNFSTATAPVFLPTIDSSRRKLNHLSKAFNFNQRPILPHLPSVQKLFYKADDLILTLNAQRTIADCSTTLPTWLPQLLGV